MAAQTGVQEKHIFKFNFRCFFLFSSPTPNCLARTCFQISESKAKLLGNCDHVRKALNNVPFSERGDSSCVRSSVFNKVEHFQITLQYIKKGKIIISVSVQVYEHV